VHASLTASRLVHLRVVATQKRKLDHVKDSVVYTKGIVSIICMHCGVCGWYRLPSSPSSLP
jgi:hypothetical protein